ncbi:hypothetical protein GF324_10700 [bacterium]|nr:hypothetical protein [bacterium]
MIWPVRVLLACLPLFLLMVFTTPCQSAVKAIPFSSSIGDTLEPAEAERIGVFTEIDGWDYAWWQERPNPDIVHLKIAHHDGTTTSVPVTSEFPEEFAPWLEKRLEAFREGRSLPLLQARLVFHDGSLLIGRIAAWPGEEIIVEGSFGSSRVRLEEILAIEADYTPTPSEIQRRAGRRYPTRLFVAPTADVLPGRKVNFTLNEILVPTLEAGLGGGLSLGGGFFPFNTDDFGMYWLTPRVRVYRSESLSAGAGIFMGWVGTNLFEDLSDRDSNRRWENFGLVNTTMTVRGNAGSLTAGLGWGYAGGEPSEQPAVYLGGIAGSKHNRGFMAEVWFLPETSPIGIVGARMQAWRFTADLGLMRQIEWGILGIPWLAISVDF